MFSQSVSCLLGFRKFMCIYVAISLNTDEPNGAYVVVAAALVSSPFALRP